MLRDCDIVISRLCTIIEKLREYLYKERYVLLLLKGMYFEETGEII